MSEFIEVLADGVKAELDSIMPLVRELAGHIKSINELKPSKTPSGADKSIDEINKKYREQNSELELIRKKLDLISSLNKQKYQEEAKLIADNDRALTYKSEKELKQIRDKQAMISSLNEQKNQEIVQSEKLNRAYVQLTANREKAKQKLQDYIAEEKRSNSEIRQAQKEFDVLNKKVAAADKAVGRFSDANRKINGLASSVGNLMAAFGVSTGLYLFVDVVKGIYETTKALQSMDLALKMVSETPLEFAKNQQFVTDVAQKWGLEIKDLTKTYTQFYTASKGLMSDESIKTTFEGIAKAGSVMGLSLESQNAAFYAIDQMMSKGTVTAEELKKQLGNAMPGAIKAAAMAYMELHPAIKSIQEAEKALYEDMKKGAIDSATYVPLIAKNFQILYGIESLNSVHTMQAAQNSLQNSWTEWIRGLGQGGAGAKIMVYLMESLAKNLDSVITVLGFSVAGWIAYKTAVMLANAQTKLLALTTTTATVATEAQTVVTGFQTTAQVANTEATVAATVATRSFNTVMKANALGLWIAGLVILYQIIDHFTKSVEEKTNAIKADTDAFITNREIVTGTIKENEKLIVKYESLHKITNKSTEQQKEYNDVLAKLSKQSPSAVTAVNNYGEATELSTKALKKYNAELKIQLDAEGRIALSKNRALIPEQQLDIKRKQNIINYLKENKGKGFDFTQEKIDAAQVELSMAKNRLTMTENSIKSMKSQTEAEKQAIIEDKKIKEEKIKNIEWFDKKIDELEKSKSGFVKRGQGLEYQKQLKALQKERAYILGEDPKKPNAAKREKKVVDFTEYTSAIELSKAQLEREKADLEQRMNNEETSINERLKLRSEFSAKSLQILDEEMQKEQAISVKKAQDDLKEVERAFRNGDIKTIEDKNRQKTAIAERTGNELAKIDINYSTKWNSLMDADNAYYKKAQKEKRDLNDETASILISIEKDKWEKIAKNEEQGINYSLAMRQKAFQENLKLARKELDLQHIKDVAANIGDDAKIAKIEAAYKKANIALDNLMSPRKEATESTRKFIEGLTDGALEKGLDNIGMKSLKMFLDFKTVTDETGTHLQSTFGKMIEDAGTTKEAFAIAFQKIGDAVQEAMDLIEQAEEAKHQRSLARLEKEKDVALSFAGDSASAKAKIEADFAKKKQALEIKEFKRKQKMALVNIAIDTAQAILQIWSHSPDPTGISQGIMTAIISGIRAVQAGIVIAQKPPEYWTGTDNAEAGLAWTQERGAEIVTDKRGYIKDLGDNKGARLTKMDKGDKVYTASETKKMMFNYDLNNLLTDNGIKESKIEVVNQGLTIGQMDSVLSKHFSNITTQHVSWDNNGVRQWSERNGNITIRNESRGSGQGFSV